MNGRYLQVLSVLLFLFMLSCDNEKVVIELGQIKYTNKDIESMLKVELKKVTDRSRLEDVIGNQLMRGLKVSNFFTDIKVKNYPDAEIRKMFEYKNAFDALNQDLANYVKSETYLERYFDRSKLILDIKHLHLQIDSLNARGYNFTQNEYENLLRTISEDLHNNPDNIDSYIIKYGYRPSINRNLGISWGYFPYELEDRIYSNFEDGKKSSEGFIKSQFGDHYVEIIKSRENDQFKEKSFSEFIEKSKIQNYSTVTKEISRYSKNYFNKLLEKSEVEYSNVDIVKALISMNGLTESDIYNRKYDDSVLATFYIENRSKKIDVKTSDIHNNNIENMFKKIAGLQMKPKLMTVYIENVVSQMLAYYELKRLNKLSLINQKRVDYETYISKFEIFKNQMKESIDVTDEEIANYFANNRDDYIEKPKRKTYGFSASISDSAKLFADYNKMTVSNLINYYVKYSPYVKASKNLQMRFLGDFQENSFGLISEEVFKLEKPKKLSQIIKYNNLFYVFYYSEETPSRRKELVEVKYDIDKQLHSEKYKMKTDSIDNLIEAKFANNSHFYAQNL